MRILGIDLAASPGSTGVVEVVAAAGDRWAARAVDGPADDDLLVGLAHGADRIGVDAPLGWPDDFVRAVTAHHALAPWPGGPDRGPLTYRTTDVQTRRHLGRFPLSVSADLLGVVGFRCALLQRRWADEVWHAPAPRDGSGVLSETYPAAALKMWGIDAKGYKARSRPDDARAVRRRIVDEILVATSTWLDLAEVAVRGVDDDHVLDALLCCLIALAVASGATEGPTEEQRDVARREGWIHVPTVALADLRPDGAFGRG